MRLNDLVQWFQTQGESMRLLRFFLLIGPTFTSFSLQKLNKRKSRELCYAKLTIIVLGGGFKLQSIAPDPTITGDSVAFSALKFKVSGRLFHHLQPDPIFAPDPSVAQCTSMQAFLHLLEISSSRLSCM